MRIKYKVHEILADGSKRIEEADTYAEATWAAQQAMDDGATKVTIKEYNVDGYGNIKSEVTAYDYTDGVETGDQLLEGVMSDPEIEEWVDNIERDTFGANLPIRILNVEEKAEFVNLIKKYRENRYSNKAASVVSQIEQLLNKANNDEILDIEVNDDDDLEVELEVIEETTEEPLTEDTAWDRGEGQLPKDWKTQSDAELEELVGYFNRLLRMLPFGNKKWDVWNGRREQVKRELEKRADNRKLKESVDSDLEIKTVPLESLTESPGVGGGPTFNLRRNGFVYPDSSEDFSDDGTRFKVYYYDPDKTGDRRFRASKAVAEGDVYLSIRFEDPVTGSSKYFDDLNGVSYQQAINGIDKLRKEIDDFKKKLDGTGGTMAITITPEEIKDIKNAVYQVVNLTGDSYYTALQSVLKKRGIDPNLLPKGVRETIQKELESEVRNAKTDDMARAKILAQHMLKNVLKVMQDRGGYDHRGKFKNNPAKTLEDALQDYEGTSIFVGWTGPNNTGQDWNRLSDYTDATQKKIKDWVRKKVEALWGDDFN